MRELQATPWHKHDPLTRAIADRVGGDIVARSEGGAMRPALEEAVRIAKERPLDESPGEGYHRSTHHEMTRAPSSTAQHLKQTVRFKQVLKTTDDFLTKLGELGADVARFEWRSWKRIMQSSASRQWHPVRMCAKDVFARIYRGRACQGQF